MVVSRDCLEEREIEKEGVDFHFSSLESSCVTGWRSRNTQKEKREKSFFYFSLGEKHVLEDSCVLRLQLEIVVGTMVL